MPALPIVAPSAALALEQSLLGVRQRRVWATPASKAPPPITRSAGEPSLAVRAKGGESPKAEGRTRATSRSAGGRADATSRSAGARAGSGATPRGARIGVISDNHGYLDPAVLTIFAGVDHIIHAGDVMDPAILEQLANVAPVTAVAGNMDSGQPTSGLPRQVAGEVAGVRFLVGHKRKRLLRDLASGDIEGLAAGEPPDLVIYGHDHIPAAAWVEGTLYLDPGSASAPHEEDDGPTVAIVEVTAAGLAVSFVPLRRRDAHDTRQRPKE